MEHSLQIAQHTSTQSFPTLSSDHLQPNLQLATQLSLQNICHLSSFIQPNLRLVPSQTIIDEKQVDQRLPQLDLGLNDQLAPISLQVNSSKHQEFFNDLENILKEQFTKKQTASLKKKRCSKNHNCAICHQQVKKKSKVYQLKCKHIFHMNCLNNWKSKRNNCPLCRKELV